MGAAAVAVREAAALLGTLAAGGDNYAGRGPEAGGLLAAAAAAAPEPGSAPLAALDEISAALDWALPAAKARTSLRLPERLACLRKKASCLQHVCAAAAMLGSLAPRFSVATLDIMLLCVMQQKSICQPFSLPP